MNAKLLASSQLEGCRELVRRAGGGHGMGGAYRQPGTQCNRSPAATAIESLARRWLAPAPYVSQPLDKVDAAQTPLPEYVACMRRAHSALAGSRQMWLRRKWMESRSTAAQTVAKKEPGMRSGVLCCVLWVVCVVCVLCLLKIMGDLCVLCVPGYVCALVVRVLGDGCVLS